MRSLRACLERVVSTFEFSEGVQVTPRQLLYDTEGECLIPEFEFNWMGLSPTYTLYVRLWFEGSDDPLGSGRLYADQHEVSRSGIRFTERIAPPPAEFEDKLIKTFGVKRTPDGALPLAAYPEEVRVKARYALIRGTWDTLGDAKNPITEYCNGISDSIGSVDLHRPESLLCAGEHTFVLSPEVALDTQ